MKQGEVEQRQKRVLILAGPNGAGKTTFAREFLPDEARCPTFVNADLIAAGLSPFRPEAAAMRAGRLMLELINDLVAREESFAFETTLADRVFVRHISTWQAAGYHVTILFLALPSADAAVQRVEERVAQGGHAIPENVIRRRFTAGRANFENLYRPLVDAWALYDSSHDEPVLLDWSEKR
ncbi:MAG: zeta toxin family protein [Polyangiaceae bacterium]